LILFAFVLALPAPGKSGDGRASLSLIPWPESVETLGGEFSLKSGAALVLPADVGPDWTGTAELFAEKLERYYGVRLEIEKAAGADCQGSIIVAPAASSCPMPESMGERAGLGDEGYALRTGASILICADTPHGLHNAFMTLLQLVSADSGQPSLPGVLVVDRPNFAWRGLMLDPARSFIPPGRTKRFIDLMSELKLNVFHWHLTDDQGFRMESRVHPRLHEVGGTLESLNRKKKKALDRAGWGADGRGYYTRDEIRDIVAYAKRRHIMVVPEIDVPGHSSAMLAAYPELSCSGKGAPIRRATAIYPSALCPGKEEVYEFLDSLFGEVASPRLTSTSARTRWWERTGFLMAPTSS